MICLLVLFHMVTANRKGLGEAPNGTLVIHIMLMFAFSWFLGKSNTQNLKYYSQFSGETFLINASSIWKIIYRMVRNNVLHTFCYDLADILKWHIIINQIGISYYFHFSKVQQTASSHHISLFLVMLEYQWIQFPRRSTVCDFFVHAVQHSHAAFQCL